ncbi:MAG: DUF3316 domain-containing protein [Porphyromonadaceae bacterium]|nr:DUF3316 domain-containing protein [Porphyromonadaceae bacterium]
MNKLSLFISIILLSIALTYSQENPVRYMQNTNMLKVGGNFLRDSYLSPLKYGGVSVGYGFESYRFLSAGDHSLILRDAGDISFDFDDNPAKNASFWGIGVNFSINPMWKIVGNLPFSIYAGPGVRAFLGGLYCTRNGNNPASLKLGADIEGMVLATYRLKWESCPILASVSWQTSLLGTTFSTQYGESYYELFMIREGSGVAKGMNFTIPSKAWYNEINLNFDFPIKNIMTLRAGYQLSNYNTNINHLHTSKLMQSFVIGFTRHLNVIKGKAAVEKKNAELIF